MPEPEGQGSLSGPAADQEMRRLTRRSFTVGAFTAAAGLGAWTWLRTATSEDGVPWPLRRILGANERLARGLFSPQRLAPTFSAAWVQGAPRANGLIGLENDARSFAWRLRVEHAGRVDRIIPLTAVQALPRSDLVTELKCVEGWSEVMAFSGVRFLDFVTQFGLATRSGRPLEAAHDPQDLYRYVYLATPDVSYYVGLDMASALHPQTLLCDTMNGRPLTAEHGAPLRLYLAVKYGFKSLKRVGLIRFTDHRPADFWADQGYDWYAGL